MEAARHHVEIPEIRRRGAVRPKTAATPGKLAAGLSLLAATGFGGYAVSTMMTPAADRQAPAAPLRLSEIPRAEFSAALATMSHRPEVQGAMDREDKSCPLHLAYVTIQRDPELPPEQPGADAAAAGVRIVSGGYVSPLFHLGPAPQRVAIPYPAPFSEGHGTISVIAGNGAVVSLLPSWRVIPGGPAATEVSWAPGPDCERPF